MTAELITPGLILVLGGLLLPLVPARLRGGFLLALPVASFWHLLQFPDGTLQTLEVMGLTLTPLRVDRLSLLFGYVFHLAALLGAIYAFGVRDVRQQVAAMVYAGSAIAAVFAGDLVTLFIYWELTAIASVFLIWTRGTERAFRVGMRYLILQVGSGVILLAGLTIQYAATESIAFGALGLDVPGGLLIFVAFGIKAAFPLLHNWVQDAYPEATITGVVFLSAFTTKLAVYALARGYAGTESLIWIGAVMAVFPVFYALIENDLRRVLAYGLISQLGFMVVGVGVGTQLALNGVAAHAVASVLYMALLFMSIGAVMLRTGSANATQLGGLYRSMPWTAAFCLIGAASISALPLFSSFVTKALLTSATAQSGHVWASLALMFASASVFIYAGLKIPYLAFFARDAGHRVDEAPPAMLVAMAITAALCIAIGVYPGALYALLPFPVDYQPYGLKQVLNQTQLVVFAGLAFVLLRRAGLYPAELRSTNLDTDWLYRRALPRLIGSARRTGGGAWARATGALLGRGARAYQTLLGRYGPHGPIAGDWPTGSMALWVAVLLAVALVLYYL